MSAGAAMSTPVPPPPPHGALARFRWGTVDALTLFRRNLSELRHTPERLSGVTVQPVIFVLLFAEVFGSAIKVAGGGSYHEFLMPGIFVQTIVFSVATTAIGVTTDVTQGFVERLRALPVARPAVLAGRMLSEFAQAILGLVVLVASGIAVGWRIHRGVEHAAVAIVLLALFSLAMIWMGVFVGLLVRSPESANGVLFPVIFPLTFLANTFVSVQGLPTWLRDVAEWNPVSALVAATRSQFGNPNDPGHSWPLVHALPVSFAWCALILAVFIPLSLVRWRRTTAG